MVASLFLLNREIPEVTIDKAVSENLIEQGEALSVVALELSHVPAFNAVVQDCLSEAVWKIAPGVLVSKVYINFREGFLPRDGAPVGRLLDVFLKCLETGKAPRYSDDYAIYDFPNSTDPRDIIPNIEISAVEKILRDLLALFSEKYTAEIKKYWEIAGRNAGKGAYPKLSRRDALAVLQAVLFARELETATQLGAITQQERDLIAGTVNGGLTGNCYGVYLETRNGEYAEQPAMFVIPLKKPIYEQLLPEGDDACVLYSPNRGVERFASSHKLKQALAARLISDDTRDEFLQALPIKVQDGFVYGSDIRFLKVNANLFERYTQQMLAKSYSDVQYHLERLDSAGSQRAATMAAVLAAQSMAPILREARQRHAQLLKLVEKNTWPQWLKNTSEVNQEVYVSLQQRLLEAEVNHHQTTGGVASLKDYARVAVEDFISPGSQERIDPDTIFVTVIHTVTLADGKKVELSERKTLTQAFMQGAHDSAGQYRVVPEAFSDNPKLTPSNIVRAIESLNIRVNYNVARRMLYSQTEVVESMREVFACRTALSMFSAVLQKHVPFSAHDLVTRYNFGDRSIETMSVSLRSRVKPFRDILVYRRKGAGAERGIHVLHMPGFVTGQDWFEFADLKALQHEIARWAFNAKTLPYLRAREHASDAYALESIYLADEPHMMLKEWWWSDIELRSLSEDGPLMGAVRQSIMWDADQTEFATPAWFRNAKVADQKLVNRLNHDFKAVYHYSKELLEIVPFKEFSARLVKNELKQYFSRKGTSVDINPDEVWVRFHADSKISLTDLFIQWQLWRSDVSVFQKFFSWVNPAGSTYVALQEQLRTASFWTFTNQPITQLNAKVINELIDLLPGEKYAQYLEDKFLTASDVNLKVSLYRKTKQNEMLRTALLQKLKGELSQDQFNWLQQLINGFDRDLPRDGAITVGGAPGTGVYELTLAGRALTGAYVFGRKVNGRDEFIIYVPNTLDGKDFFPLDQLASRLGHECKSAALKLVRLEHKAIVESLVEKYARNQPPIAQPQLTNSYPILSFGHEYTQMIGHILSDVDFQTTSPAEAAWKDARLLADLALDVVSMFIPPLGFVVSVLRISQSVVQGIVAYSQGLDSAGNAHFASAWRGAITLYVGKVAAIGTPVNPLALLSSVRDIADLITAVTGVEVSINYLTAVAAPPSTVNSTSRLI